MCQSLYLYSFTGEGDMYNSSKELNLVIYSGRPKKKKKKRANKTKTQSSTLLCDKCYSGKYRVVRGQMEHLLWC